MTGLHAENRTRIDAWRQIYYRHGGDRVGELNSFDSWKEARMTLVANGIKNDIRDVGEAPQYSFVGPT